MSEAAEQTPTPEGAICHIEIPAPDLAKAKEFYTKVFGWTVNAIPGMDYLLFNTGKIGGGFDPKARVVESGGANIVLYTENIPATLKKIEAAGGATVREPHLIAPGIGYAADFRDPNGNQLCLFAPDHDDAGLS